MRSASAARCASGGRKKGSLGRFLATTRPTTVERPVAMSVVGKMAAGSFDS